MEIGTSRVIKNFGTWVVTSYGIECLTDYYPIEKKEIYDIDWERQIREKMWSVPEDFNRALEFAREHWPKKKFIPKHKRKDRVSPNF
jgi:hypothetical protein